MIGIRDNSFNFSRLINAGMQAAAGEYVILLNNDTEVISENWIQEMLGYMKMDGVGVVSGKLLFVDNSIQHAGVVLQLNDNLAGHAFKHFQDADGGYLSYALVPRNYSAVTAACLMTKKKYFNDIGGFDETNFRVAYNDVDFCMRMRANGLRIVYNPYVKLYHHEGKSRGVLQEGKYDDPKEELLLYNKWSYLRDRYYNPNLNLSDEAFKIDCRYVLPITCQKTIRLLFISHNLNYEGAPLIQLYIAEQLLKKGYNFSVLAPQEGPLRERYEKLGIKVFMFKNNFLECLSLSHYIENLRRMTAILDGDYDIVFSNTLLAFWGIDIGEILCIPSILGIHESVDYKSYYSNFPKHIAERALQNIQRATRVIFVSKATARMFNDLDTGNFAVIPNAVDIEKVEGYKSDNSRGAVRRDLGIKDKETVITITGTTCQRKGQIVFAKAARLLLNQTKRDDLIFYIVGGRKSPYLTQLEDYIRSNGLNEKLRVIMETPDILRYYYSSDIFVCASYEESSPLVILEAMSFNLPIIATNVFGIPELIRNNIDGILIEPGNEEILAEKMKFYLDEERIAKRIAQNAYYRLLRKYNFNRFASDYDDCFRSVYSEGENRVFKELVENKE